MMDIGCTSRLPIRGKDLLSQVWINLIHNSIKSTRRYTGVFLEAHDHQRLILSCDTAEELVIKSTPEHGKVSIALQRKNDQAEFQISDTGPGISEADQARIFERFYKGDKSRIRTDSSGSGLGLSIVQKIVEIHHGTITVNSALGAGTTFTVSLPTK